MARHFLPWSLPLVAWCAGFGCRQGPPAGAQGSSKLPLTVRGRGSSPRERWLAILALLLVAGLVAGLWAQDPADSADHPPGNINELTLAGLRPGRTSLASAEKRLGGGWQHPSRDEKDMYVWCDASTRLRLSLEVQSGIVHVVTVEKFLPRPLGQTRERPGQNVASHPRPDACTATLRPSVARTGRGVKLGDTPARLKSVYGKPFFQGPASWEGRNVDLIVFNFSWAGPHLPQILESSFDNGRLVKMTLSAEYY